MAKFNFNGRPDGLGNRIEEIIQLEAICKKEKITFNYVWENSIHRNYGILLQADRVQLVETVDKAAKFRQFSDFSTNFTQEDILSVAKQITPLFNIQFKDQIKPIGVHLRGTDRLMEGTDHPHFMKDGNEFNMYLSKTIAILNKIKPEFVFVCADDEVVKQCFIKRLNVKIKLIEPICNEAIPEEYRDFFSLTLCSKLYMVSRFSSYSITASLIGNIPIISYVHDKVVEDRYKAIFEYDLNLNRIHIFKIYKQKNYTPNLARRITSKLKNTLLRYFGSS